MAGHHCSRAGRPAALSASTDENFCGKRIRFGEQSSVLGAPVATLLDRVRRRRSFDSSCVAADGRLATSTSCRRAMDRIRRPRNALGASVVWTDAARFLESKDQAQSATTSLLEHVPYDYADRDAHPDQSLKPPQVRLSFWRRRVRRAT